MDQDAGMVPWDAPQQTEATNYMYFQSMKYIMQCERSDEAKNEWSKILEWVPVGGRWMNERRE